MTTGTPSQPRAVFRSRIDWWLAVIIFGVLGLAVWKTLADLLANPRAASYIGFGVSAGVLAATAWLFATIRYEIDDTSLYVCVGPMRSAVPIAAIRRIKRSSTLLASPALSLRRLEIDYNKYDTAIVSPKDQAVFIAALTTRNPNIET
ncbi:MAG TPA: PH domain-containing protein [Gemmatimonadaceae bacterium]|nr:PH domain-containing protein [Gemmatimonadaceae bacterium]HRQ78751.1 PH domain-containing protein [Gemmatimonadaceae bacterium]